MKTTYITTENKKQFTVETRGRIADILRSYKPEIVGSNYNGYGYQDHDYTYTVSHADYLAIKKIIREKNKKPVKNVKTYAEKKEAWIKRLTKLTGISIEESAKIAEEKEAYKKDRIQEMEDREAMNPSRRRQQLINKMQRENPLRRIEDADHAQAILSASNRHNNTNYEALLEEGREKAMWGEIDREEVKDYARQNYQ